MNATVKHEERMARFCRAGLYLVTSEPLSCQRTTVDIVKAALAGGVRLIQLREKEMTVAQVMLLARRVRRLTVDADALLIINDRIDVALAAGADGVHLGQTDFPVSEARRLAPDFIIGASTHSVAEARAAQSAGASYINIGPIFQTRTKAWTGGFLGMEGLKRIARAVTVPYTVMGGIKKHHIPELLEAGAKTIALVTAVTAADDPEQAARELVSTINDALSPGKTERYSEHGLFMQSHE